MINDSLMAITREIDNSKPEGRVPGFRSYCFGL